MRFEITVGEEDRIIVINDYTYVAGRKMHMPSPSCDTGCPAEPAEVNDIECVWQDTGLRLDDRDWDLYGEIIEESCWNDLKNAQECAENEDVDHRIDMMKERQ